MNRSRYRGCLLGLACGDAVGTTVEFMERGTFPPVTGMEGGGPFGLKPGEWTDDTSMALCPAASLIECGEFDPTDQMNRYCNWVDNGYMSSNGRCFDIGTTVRSAINKYRVTGDPFAGSTDPWSAGNGAIMRLAPVPMMYAGSSEKTIFYSGESARTTHGAAEAIDATRLFGAQLRFALLGESKEDLLFAADYTPSEERVAAIAGGEYRDKKVGEIIGSGYIVNSLEAALWSFYTTESYKDAILRATNLGNDADTTAAICGQIAGAYYGVEEIPTGWYNRVVLREEIEGLADGLFEKSESI